MFLMKHRLSLLWLALLTLSMPVSLSALSGCSDSGTAATGGTDGIGTGTGADGSYTPGAPACGGGCQVGAACVNDVCQCQAGLALCGAECIDLTSNGNHCGACGTICGGATPFCSGSVCSATCAVGQTPCGNSCVDVLSDAANCNGCGLACTGGYECTGGMCTCPTGASCDFNPGTGGVPGAGGTSGGGGTTAAGGTGGGGPAGPSGGYITQDTWHGYMWTAKFGTATVTPSDFGDIFAMPACMSGSVPNTSSGAMLGWNINQQEVGDSTGTVYTPTKGGILVSTTNASNAALRLQIQTPNGADVEEERWCADIGVGGTNVFVPYSAFYVRCWADDPADRIQYAGQNISQVIVQVVGKSTATNFSNVCVTSLQEANDPNPVTTTGCNLDTAVSGPQNQSFTSTGAQNTTRGAANSGTPQYGVQANVFTPSSGTFTLSSQGNSFTITTQSMTQATNGAPIAYPSFIVGSSGGDGYATNGSNLPKQVSSIVSVPTALRWTAGAVGAYNVAYDVWFNANGADAGAGSRSFLMVWFHRSGGIVAEGQGVPGHSGKPFTIGGKTFDVFVSTQFEGRPIISYVTQSQIGEWAFDLNAFIKDAKTQTSSARTTPVITDSMRLTNIFAGFEIWNGSQGIKVDKFCALVN